MGKFINFSMSTDYQYCHRNDCGQDCRARETFFWSWSSIKFWSKSWSYGYWIGSSGSLSTVQILTVLPNLLKAGIY